jgi:hypothetical protein
MLDLCTLHNGFFKKSGPPLEFNDFRGRGSFAFNAISDALPLHNGYSRYLKKKGDNYEA